MQDLTISYTDDNGVRVRLTRGDDTDMTDDLAAVTLRLLRDARVSPFRFYDTLRETLQYEVDGFDRHLADLAERYAEPAAPERPRGKWATNHIKRTNNAPAVYPGGANQF